MPRILIMGPSCSGKSTLADQVGHKLGLPVTHLDDLFWNPGWVQTELEPFREKVGQVVAEEDWVIDGNYSRVTDLTRPRATRIVWLELAFGLVLSRCLRRTLGRALVGGECCNGNRESLYRSLCTRDSMIWWVLTTHHNRRKRYAEELAPGTEHGHKVVRLRSPQAVRDWLKSLSVEDSEEPTGKEALIDTHHDDQYGQRAE